MKSTSSPRFHGYVSSTFDNAVRVHLTNGQIVALKILSNGIEARLWGQQLHVTEELRQICTVSSLVNFLQAHRLSLMNQEIIIERQTTGVSPQVIKTSPPISFEDL